MPKKKFCLPLQYFCKSFISVQRGHLFPDKYHKLFNNFYQYLQTKNEQKWQVCNSLQKQVKEFIINLFIYSFLQLLKPIMETQHQLMPSSTFSDLSSDTLENIFKYLTPQQLALVMNICLQPSFGQESQQSGNLVLKLANSKQIMQNYFNFTDKSLYFSIYQSLEYKMSESNKTFQLAFSQSYPQFHTFPTTFTNLIKQLQELILPGYSEEFGQKVKQFFVDPSIPIPKLMRQNIGLFANTSFQMFLVSKIDNDNSFDYKEEMFEQIQQNFRQDQQEKIKSVIKNRFQSSFLVNKAHQINHKNLHTLLIPNNKHHNLLATLFAITQLYLQNLQSYLSLFSDSYELILELTTRYNLFCNTIISVEESLGSIFAEYGAIYQQIYEGGSGLNHNRFSYWKPAMTMWISKMQKFHKTTNKAYLNLNNFTMGCQLKNKVKDISLIDQYIERAQVYSYNYQWGEKAENMEQVNMSIKNSGVIQYFLKNNPEEIGILLKSYGEYLIDFSVTQKTVHFNNHSKLSYGTIYYQVQKLLVESQEYLIHSLSQSMYTKNELDALNTYMSERICAFSNNFKGHTVEQILMCYEVRGIFVDCPTILKNDQQINNYIKFISRNREYQKLEKVEIPKYIRGEYSQSAEKQFKQSIINNSMIDTNDSQNSEKQISLDFEHYYSEDEQDFSPFSSFRQ